MVPLHALSFELTPCGTMRLLWWNGRVAFPPACFRWISSFARSLCMKPKRLVYAPTRSRRLNEMLGLILVVSAAILLLSITTYTPSDPSFNTASGAPRCAAGT